MMPTNAPMTAKQQIFRNRARTLAAEATADHGAIEGIDVVEIRLAHERYALESAYVREVFPLREWTPLPATPEYVLGVINVRGQILSVMDLRVFFELPREAVTKATKVVVLRSDDMELGIVADAVIEARSIALTAIRPPLPTITGIREAYLRGVAEDDLVILDAARLLADKSIIVNEQVEGELR